MVDLDELDRLHASLPALEPQAVCDEFSATWRATIASADDDGDDGAVGQHERMTEASESAVAILNTWPEVSRELRERRALGDAGVGAGMVDLDELDRVIGELVAKARASFDRKVRRG